MFGKFKKIKSKMESIFKVKFRKETQVTKHTPHDIAELLV